MAFFYLITWFLFCCAHPLPCETQNVFFGFKDRSGADQALRLGDKNVTITCNISCVDNAIIQIRNGHESEWFTTNNVGTSLDYTIDEVMDTTELQFSCLVIFNVTEFSGGVSNKSVEVDIFLPVLDKKNLTCRRNGTEVSATAQTGDIFSLQCFCYFSATGPCQWAIIGDNTFKTLNSTSSYSSNGTVLLVEATVNYSVTSLFLCGQMNDTKNSQPCFIQQNFHDKVFPSKVLSNECDLDHTTTTDHTSFDKVNTTTHKDKAVGIKTTVTKKKSPFESLFDELENLSTEVLILCVIGIVILIITICIIITTGCLIKNAKGKIKEHDEEKKVPEESMYADIPEKMQESALSTDADRLYDAPPFMTKGVVPNYYIKQQ